MMLSAKEPVIRNKFFFPEIAWLTPRRDSIFPKPTYGEWRIVFSWPAFPDTAVIGDTFAACFAGAFAAISTVISPTKIPQAMPKILMPKRGISENEF